MMTFDEFREEGVVNEYFTGKESGMGFSFSFDPVVVVVFLFGREKEKKGQEIGDIYIRKRNISSCRNGGFCALGLLNFIFGCNAKSHDDF